jgi:hypothetical protein
MTAPAAIWSGLTGLIQIEGSQGPYTSPSIVPALITFLKAERSLTDFLVWEQAVIAKSRVKTAMKFSLYISCV